jgi:hypothetical protein
MAEKLDIKGFPTKPMLDTTKCSSLNVVLALTLASLVHVSTRKAMSFKEQKRRKSKRSSLVRFYVD